MQARTTSFATLTTPDHVETMSLEQFIDAVGSQYAADPDALAVLYKMGNDNGLRAVLLRFDAIADYEAHHYIVHNNAKLVHCQDLTPWALGLPKSIEDPNTGKTFKKIDITAELALEYQSAKVEALRLLTRGQL